jgi:hypothetical protein
MTELNKEEAMNYFKLRLESLLFEDNFTIEELMGPEFFDQTVDMSFRENIYGVYLEKEGYLRSEISEEDLDETERVYFLTENGAMYAKFLIL